MNDCHLKKDEIEQYRQRMLSPAALLAVDDHLAQCEDCRKSLVGTVESATGSTALRRALTGDESKSGHLSYDDLVAFVEDDWKIADRQTVLEHLSQCKECAQDAEGLRQLRPERKSQPSIAEPTASPKGNRRTSWTIPVWAGVAAVLLLAGYLGLKAYRGRIRPQAEIVAQLNDGGGSIKLDSSGQLTMPFACDTNDVAEIKAVLLRQRIEPSSALSQLRSPDGTLLSESGQNNSSLRLIAPLSTVVPSDKPVFRWQPLSSATYIISVYDTHYTRVTESPPVQQADWSPDLPLPRGQIYTWQVTALLRGERIRVPLPPAPEARFEVLSQAEFEQFDEASREHANSHLLMGILYARAGALDDAERELAVLLAANPDSQVASKLLASVQQLRSKNARTGGGTGSHEPFPIRTKPAQ